ncbi:hypothetical protein PIB30_080386 [Stylosanthes scabra]|uniref:DUF4283 domain-containing protein n=1 Tax=Stylosanthes scabra TaxID=79078 RepID=A0ABU6RRE6_9FABA|nr:hypothetical protein [Stylosanthes scabra]
MPLMPWVTHVLQWPGQRDRDPARAATRLHEAGIHWDTLLSLSRRVWIEIMGMPTGLWFLENFDRIAKLWGKVVRYDDRTEESKSYSVARILIDSFQWEMIHEWINVKIDDRKFEIFVKEFGSEVYSVQSHPDREVESSVKVEAASSEPEMGTW